VPSMNYPPSELGTMICRLRYACICHADRQRGLTEVYQRKCLPPNDNLSRVSQRVPRWNLFPAKGASVERARDIHSFPQFSTIAFLSPLRESDRLERALARFYAATLSLCERIFRLDISRRSRCGGSLMVSSGKSNDTK